MNQRSIAFLKGAVFVMGMIVLILSIFALPALAKNAANMNPEFAYLKYPVLIGLYLTVIPFFFALYQALTLLKYIETNQAFSELAVKSLGLIKHCATVIVVIYLIGMVLLGILNALHPGIAIIGFVILFASLVILIFTAVLQELLKNVLKIKIENDLTV